MLEMPKLLRDILEHAIGHHSGCELLGSLQESNEILRAPTMSPDVVIMGLIAAEDATLVPALFARWPNAQVVTVMPAGEDAIAYELRPHRRILGPLSPDEIVETLQAAVRRGRELPQEWGD